MIEESFRGLEERSKADFSGSGIKFERFLDVRYRRQAHEITIPYKKDFISEFHRTHKKMYGYMKPESEVEVVTLRLRAIAEKKNLDLPMLEKEICRYVGKTENYLWGKGDKVNAFERESFYPGFKFSGPALVFEDTSTLFITPGYRCEVDGWGNIVANYDAYEIFDQIC